MTVAQALPGFVSPLLPSGTAQKTACPSLAGHSVHRPCRLPNSEEWDTEHWKLLAAEGALETRVSPTGPHACWVSPSSLTCILRPSSSFSF